MTDPWPGLFWLPQPSGQPLQEQVELLLCQSSACATRLEHAQLLLAQYAETQEELFPWLEETQEALGRLSLDTASCDTLKGQQVLLQVTETVCVWGGHSQGPRGAAGSLLLQPLPSGFLWPHRVFGRPLLSTSP